VIRRLGQEAHAGQAMSRHWAAMSRHMAARTKRGHTMTRGKGDGQTQAKEAVDGSRVRSKPARRWRARPCRDQTQAQAEEAPCQGRLSNGVAGFAAGRSSSDRKKRSRPIRAFSATSNDGQRPRIFANTKDDRNCRGGNRLGRIVAGWSGDNGHATTYEVGHEGRKAIELPSSQWYSTVTFWLSK
jgi:hypothetical protein